MIKCSARRIKSTHDLELVSAKDRTRCGTAPLGASTKQVLHSCNLQPQYSDSSRLDATIYSCYCHVSPHAIMQLRRDCLFTVQCRRPWKLSITSYAKRALTTRLSCYPSQTAVGSRRAQPALQSDKYSIRECFSQCKLAVIVFVLDSRSVCLPPHLLPSKTGIP